MKLILEIHSGELAGHKHWLRPGERLVVGRTDQAELSVPDAKMSSVHFFVECTAAGSRVHDMHSTNGTMVNGAPVSEGLLQNGDTIVAGETKFRVQISDEASSVHIAADSAPGLAGDASRGGTSIRRTVLAAREPGPQNAASPLARAPAPAPATRAATEKTPADQKPMACGASARVFPGGPQVAVQLAARISAIAPLYLVVDFAGLARHVPAELESGPFLYDWFPEKLIPSFSPVLFSSSAPVDWQALLKLGWGHNCILCLCSGLPEEELARQMKQLTRLETAADQPRPLARPDVLLELLSGGAEAVVRGFFQAVDAVLLEAEDGDRNYVIAPAAHAPRLPEIQLDLIPPESE